MHILYLDESGGPNSWSEQENFVLGGIAVHEGQIYSLTKELNALQEKYLPGITIPIEFHVGQIRQGHIAHFKKLSRDTRFQFIDEVYDIIGKYVFPNLMTFATVIDVTAVTGAIQVCHDCFEDVSQHFNLFLYHQFLRSARERGISHKGLLIIDRGREKEYRQLFHTVKQSEAVEEYLGNIVDIPYFTACRETRMLQLADFVANATFRYYESGVTEQFEKISHQFYRGPYHRPVPGLNHITKDKTCQCYACSRVP